MIYNPTAKGDKARRFRQRLADFGNACVLKQTPGPGEAKRLAAEAVGEGFLTIVAAGGDGTVNEVVNGIASTPLGLERTRLGVLPLGTVNVFARELGIPTDLDQAWKVILNAKERRIDLPLARMEGSETARHFAQLAGAGLDARAIELVHYPLKRKIGPLAYIYAGLKALTEPACVIEVEVDGAKAIGGLVLIGNGRLYGGTYRLFPEADLTDGLLEVCVFQKVGWLTLARCGPHLLVKGCLPGGVARWLRGKQVRLSSAKPVSYELDGEWGGKLPVVFGFAPSRLGVIVP